MERKRTMMMRMNGRAIACALMMYAGTAHAGDTSTSGTDSGSESGTDSGSETTAADTGTSTTLDTGGFDEGSCGNCSPGADGAITFVAPADGAVVQSPFTVEVTAEADCGCDDCGCYDDVAEQLAIAVDDVPYGEPCASSSCSFELDLPGGPHIIRVTASFDFHENSDSLLVNVAEDPGDPTASATDANEGSESAGESSSAGANDDDDESSGCSCRADTPGTGGVSAAFVLFGLFAATRRPRR